ncbi:MAG: RNA polymerase sigma factor [Desulfotignum sp.]|nr:RNA polymerase sigma factor [Desulfotignum sp.]
MTDEELMAAYKQGDANAFHILYNRHKGRLMGYLIARLKDPDDAEDIFQSIYAKLHASRYKYRQDIPFLPWFFTIAKNTMIDQIRKNNTRKKHIRVDAEYINTRADKTKTAHQQIGSAIPELSRLNDSQRQTLALRFNEGLSFQEIAAHLETTSSNARQTASRAVRTLRKLLAGKGEKK